MPFQSCRRWTLSSALAPLLLSASLLTAALPNAVAAEDLVTLNFVNADIDTVAKAVSQITGKNFLIDPRVKGTVNIVSGKPVPQSVIYPFLLSALRMQGFAAIENNGMVRIVPEADAKTYGGPMFDAGKPGGAQMATKVFPLRYESATQLVPVLRPLIAPANSITANINNNSLVVSDYADNLARIEKIVEALDAPRGEEPQVIPVRHASAIDLATTLNRLYGDTAGGAGDASQRSAIIADTRTNSIIVRSDNPGKLERIRGMIESLDQPTGAAGNIHVVYLRNAEAVKVAQTLRSIVTGEVAPNAASSLSSLSSSPSAPQATGGSVGTTPLQGMTPNAAQGVGTGAGNAGGFIQADATHNALIITAPEAVYNNLRRVIDMLDTRRAQVFVEALIVELNSDRAFEMGIQWQALGNRTTAGGTNFGSGNNNLVGLLQNIATNKAGTAATTITSTGSTTITSSAPTTSSLSFSPGLNLGVLIGKGLDLAVLGHALESEANANVLSTPNILTLDNEEARIIVGSNVPFVTGQYAQTGNTATATPFQTYERHDVGLTLKIRPQISEGGGIRLQIFQEASTIQEGSISNASGPITNKRSIESAVVVDDGGIVAIGGLIQDTYGLSEDKVPVLGDLPLLGGLFRYQSRKRSKTNLMVFLRPKIIRDAAGYQSITADRYDYIMGEQQKSNEGARLMWGEKSVPTLPALPEPVPAPAAAAPPATQ